MSENETQIQLLMEATGCDHRTAINALTLREGILDFSIEYIKRRDILSSMSQDDRFPLWFQYLTQKRRV